MTEDPIVKMCRRFKRRWSKDMLEGLSQAEMDEIKANEEEFIRRRDGEAADRAEIPK